VVQNVRTTKKTPGVMTLEVNQSNVDVHYSKTLWEGTMEDSFKTLERSILLNLADFWVCSLFFCGGGLEGVINFDLSKRGKKESLSRF